MYIIHTYYVKGCSIKNMQIVHLFTLNQSTIEMYIYYTMDFFIFFVISAPSSIQYISLMIFGSTRTIKKCFFLWHSPDVYSSRHDTKKHSVSRNTLLYWIEPLAVGVGQTNALSAFDGLICKTANGS